MDYYVYILQSVNHLDKYYVGFSTDVKERLRKHNEGGDKHTAKYKPWKIKNTVSVDDKTKALEFEKYLKSHSGWAFTKKHF